MQIPTFVIRLLVREGANKDERAGVNVGQTAAYNFQRGESDACVRLQVTSGACQRHDPSYPLYLFDRRKRQADDGEGRAKVHCHWNSPPSYDNIFYNITWSRKSKKLGQHLNLKKGLF